MSYHLPPNNNIKALLNQDQPESIRQEITDVDRQLQLADINNTPEGNGAVRGWSGRGGARRR